MRISHITLSHYLNHRSLNVPVDPKASVLFVCGNNGSGKTGIAQGIRLALTGQPIRGLQYKNQLGELITQGEKDGVFAVSIENGGSDHTYNLSLRTGNYSGSSPELPGHPISLDPEQFIAMDAAARRKLLFNITGIQLKAESIVQTLVEDGHDLDRVKRIAGALRGGFEAAANEAKTAATEARGGWKAVTGETYGSTKAATWRAPVPTNEVKESLEDVKALVDDLKARVDRSKTEAENLRRAAEANAAAGDAKGAKDKLAENEKALAELTTQRAEVAKEIDALRQSAQYKGGHTCPCPKCGEMLAWSTVGVLQTWEDAKPKMDPPAAHTALKQAEQQLATADQRIDRVRQLVADGKAAEKLLSNLPPMPAAGAVREAENVHQRTQAELAIANADLNVLTNYEQEKARAAEKTKRAGDYHVDVEAFTKLAEKVTELPARYLASAIKSVQELLDIATKAYGVRVSLGEDMELYFGTIPYGLASDSQQWRLRAAIGYALAILGGLGVVVLDKFDVVQVKDRGPILSWLAKQSDVQVVLCGTLKELPKLPEPPFQLVWLEK